MCSEDSKGTIGKAKTCCVACVTNPVPMALCAMSIARELYKDWNANSYD